MGTLVQVQVLRGVVIMFSRIIPLDEVPSQHALWLRAEAFGARCTAQTDDAVTHLVTNTQHTLKVLISCCLKAAQCSCSAGAMTVSSLQPRTWHVKLDDGG